MTFSLRFLLIAVAGVALLGGRVEAMETRIRGVIEMFTSQACALCPPADRLMRELARDDSLVSLSYPVDYWDYTGWKDTLALPACGARQKAYAAARGDAHVYTPQAVINGLRHVPGADRAAIESTFSATGPSSLGVGVRATLSASPAGLAVGVEGPPETGPARVLLIGVIRESTVVIGRGENRGAKITYANVVRSVVDLGEFRGGSQSYSAPRGEGDFHIALVQQGDAARPGAVLAAARR
jgi:hypothetical protein